MNNDLKKLPIIDWDLSLKLAGNQKDLADDILAMLVANLPDEVAVIKQLNAEKNYQELRKHVHKMHGALSYSGLSRIKNLISHIESELKTNIIISLPSLIEQLETELQNLLKQLPRQT